MDNSGTLECVSIRHSGSFIGAGSESNGLTLGGVGSGTTIANIEVVAGLDDGVECLGGTVDVSNLTIGFMSDDGLDIDMNYAGTVENFTIVINENSDKVIEADGPEGTTYTDGLFTLENGTVLTEGNVVCRSDFKSNAKGTITNVDFNGGINLAATYDASCSQLIGNSLFYLLESTPQLTFNSCDRTIVSYQSYPCIVNPTDVTAAEGLITPVSTQGNTNSDLDWTWLRIKGKL